MNEVSADGRTQLRALHCRNCRIYPRTQLKVGPKPVINTGRAKLALWVLTDPEQPILNEPESVSLFVLNVRISSGNLRNALLP